MWRGYLNVDARFVMTIELWRSTLRSILWWWYTIR
jgi:hypothetical protein